MIDYMKIYNKWKDNSNLDSKLRSEMEKLDENGIADCFTGAMEFGTAGLRGKLGPGPNRMNIYTVGKVAEGYARYLVSLGEEVCSRGVVIGYDNRHYSDTFAKLSADIFATHGIKVYLFSSLRPTPVVSYAVRELKSYGGVMITASHNPKEYNGYKLYDELGCQILPEVVEEVVKYVDAVEDELNIKIDVKDSSLIKVIDEEIDSKYQALIKDIKFNDVNKKAVKVVYSSQHGTGITEIKPVLEALGYDIIYVEDQCVPDPDFSATKSPNPEEAVAYEKAIEVAKENGADLIVITDPDADRLGIAVLHNGEYKLVDGNSTGAILLEYYLSSIQIPNNGVVFNTIVTSDIGEQVVKAHGAHVEKTLTGFKYIGDRIHEYEQSNEKAFLFGYEESYGYLIKDFVRDKDAVQATVLLCECACYYKEQQKTLVDVLDELFAKHGYYYNRQRSMVFEGVEGVAKIKGIMSTLRENPPKLINGIEVISYYDYQLKTGFGEDLGSKLPTADVLKYILADGSWVAVRPSGTEPKCKIYYCIKEIDEAKAIQKHEAIDKAMLDLLK